MLFFVVYVVLCHTQKLFGFNSVRYLAENAGSMQAVQGDRNPKTGHHLDHSEHFQLFLHCLGLPNQIPAKQWVWDAGPFLRECFPDDTLAHPLNCRGGVVARLSA